VVLVVGPLMVMVELLLLVVESLLPLALVLLLVPVLAEVKLKLK
jgi:hypothetical protein